ncbi:hypothetical protein [Chryseobacterium sp. Leaf394]|uniref:hypothetical protein n=1 Tax=Chryseobacterium sp. Leaf394 TaxID=1736361 RepID=UPI000FF891F6|nr:hypothetical protein [Chryseobacterium sp. Leaf394]
MKSKIVIVVFLLCAQGFFAQITVTGGASLYVDGKNLSSTSEKSEKEFHSEIILVGKIKVVSENHYASNEIVIQKKVKKTAVKKFANLSGEKKTIVKKIRTRKKGTPVFTPFPNDDTFLSSHSKISCPALPTTTHDLKLTAILIDLKSNITLFPDRKKRVFRDGDLLFFNHYRSSLNVRPPPFIEGTPDSI